MSEQQTPPDFFRTFAFPLSTGRVIQLSELIQWQTYDGLLCGFPYREVNEERIDLARNRALKLLGDQYPITVLEPEITAYDDFPTAEQRQEAGYFGIYAFKCEALPPVCCAAIFESSPTSRDEGCVSSGILIWFQHEWGTPTIEIQRQIGKLDWGQIARDWWW